MPSGQPVQLPVFRAGGSRPVTVRPTDPPRDLGLRILWEVAGLRVAQARGIVGDEVAHGSRSESIGLAQGDVIVGVNGIETPTVDALNQQLTQSADRSSIVLSVARGRYVYNLTFPMGA